MKILQTISINLGIKVKLWQLDNFPDVIKKSKITINFPNFDTSFSIRLFQYMQY
jgi:hypothetical protein